MRPFLAVVAVVFLPGPALAQDFPDFRGNDLRQTLTIPAVQSELKLDASQIERFKAHVEATNAMMVRGGRAVMERVRTLKKDERHQLDTQILQDADDASMKFIPALLKSDQLKRLRQIDVQFRGVRAFGFPEVLDKLKLSDDQSKKVRAVLESDRASSHEIVNNKKGTREGKSKLFMSLRENNMNQLMNLLTGGQKAAWKELVGEPFRAK